MAKGTGFISIIQSTLASAFGVQSSKNKDRDFEKGRPAHFIIAGIVGTVIFILLLVLIVNIVLATS